MPINFHDKENRLSYALREADQSWKQAMLSLVQPKGMRLADVGCGGGIYAHAWLQLGASSVLGVDSSEVMIQTGSEHANGHPQLSYVVGEAQQTGLDDGAVDLVFERALIHHVKDLDSVMAEAFRILRDGGRIIIQDRTFSDVCLPGSPTHIRGYFFEVFPELLDIEAQRRWTDEQVSISMERAGFRNVSAHSVFETRRRYTNFDELAVDLRQRTGRSILHELTTEQIEELVGYLRDHLVPRQEIIERDRWTCWYAERN